MNQQLIYPISVNQANEIREKSTSGKKEFAKAQLRKARLQGIDLSFANLRGADLCGADLSQSILNGADLRGANLNSAKFNSASLRGANLSEAQLAWVSLVEANLSGANLSETSVDAATLKKASLQGTNLSGAYLRGADLEEAILKGAYYDHQTHFELDFDPTSAGMQMETKITVNQLLHQFNQISQLSHHYLGSILTARYWESSRPNFDWLNKFQVASSSAQITFPSKTSEPLHIEQLQWSQQWLNTFIRYSSQIVREMPILIERKQLGFTVCTLS